MKVTPKLESDYDKVKKMDESKFITKETIKDFVAAELFIPIVEELYDNNIFTCWSGLEGDAHIRIPLDGLSKENWKIAKENCINNPNNWKIQKPPYRDLKDILPNYTLEIFVRYKDGITDVSEVVSKLLTEIRKLSYQDVQIAKPEYARYSQLPRLTLAGLYKQSEVSTFNSETKGEYMVPAESYEELSKMFLDGETPEYFYDDETDTYFRNKVLIKKSKEYREYEKSPEKRKEREINNISKRLNEEMTDEQKYKVIFDWMINYFKYDYKMLYDTQSYELMVKIRTKYRDALKQGASRIENFSHMNQEECVKALIAFFQDNDNKEYTEMIDLLKWSLSCKEKAKQFIKREKEYHYGNIYMTRYGVCKDFAKEFKDFCDKLNLPCETIQGDILSDGVKCGHAWNVVMINGKLKHIDISSAIHCVDGTNSDNTPDDFFLKTFEELTAADNGKGREILESSRKTIKSFISKSTGFNIED